MRVRPWTKGRILDSEEQKINPPFGQAVGRPYGIKKKRQADRFGFSSTTECANDSRARGVFVAETDGQLMLSPEHCPNILVVDDEPFIVQYVRRVLEHSNYGVVTATNAEQAWAFFEQRQVRISLLLTDIVMPGLIDGLDLAAKIRKVEPAFPILFLSGAIPDGDPRAAGIMEKCLLLRKPFFPKELLDFVGAASAANRQSSDARPLVNSHLSSQDLIRHS
ncbi:MAG TPA: response regulator [Candidatus Acidoferrum sp.]|nr:response regulator [Candidatus Acidoferrum sp.]